jgi:type I restriction-modification system DNA methylase subunit
MHMLGRMTLNQKRGRKAATRDRVTEDLVQKHLQELEKPHSINSLKELFWSDLEYTRAKASLPYSNWPDTILQNLDSADSDGPILLFATGGNDNQFHVIYIHLATEKLSLDSERKIVTQLLKDHPDALFIFSNLQQNTWHFVNVKSDTKNSSRLLFRRITIGPNEHLRTASERLALLNLVGTEHESLLEIRGLHEKAFDVEAVTKRFFEAYRKVFERVEREIQGFTNSENRRLFTQRLFNRLMFIAFIQKKGWLSFNGQTDYLNALWQDYRKNANADSNFYVDRLSLLFFSALNTDNEVNVIDINRKGFIASLIGNPPYLNGGLFEESEEDKNPSLIVPDTCIQAILEELFDHFNFTVTESTPLDIEVAVDPEMLGKVFEELVTGRHETGSYYTPKPVVSFMCREALKGYLHAKRPSEAEEAIAQFVDEHSPQGLHNPEAVLDILRKIKVCDPACGSGAYLLGMLHELLDLRTCLFATRNLDAISVYQRKLEIIQNNVYGVDLDPFAVNIARLRLWLSLEVDFEGDKPLPLPNLDFKIEVGDSLLAPDPEGALNLAFRDELVQQFLAKKAAYISAHHGEKQTLRKEIDELRQQIAQWTHSDGSSVTGFDWTVEFAEVFIDGGFDVIVANPPYVRQELIKELKPSLKKVYPDIYSGTADLYCYFYARALQLLRNDGMLVFISSNKWFRANYGAILRKHIAETCWVRSITDFGDLPVFESATAYPMIFIAQKEQVTDQPTLYTEVESLEPPYPDVLVIIQQNGHLLSHGSLNGSDWMLFDADSSTRLRKMKAAGIPLGEYVKGQIYRGILTGLNQAFVIDGVKRAELIAQDPKSAEIIKPLIIGRNIGKWKVANKGEWLIFTRRGIDINSYPAVLGYLQQFREQLEPRPEEWDSSHEWPGRKLGPYKWYELQDPIAYHEAFEKPKIIWGNLGLEPEFTFVSEPLYVMAPANLIPLDDLYLLGLMNSSSSRRFFDDISIQRNGNYLEFKPIYVKQLPVPDASVADHKAISDLVQKCLKAQGIGCNEWEREIDERVAALYRL